MTLKLYTSEKGRLSNLILFPALMVSLLSFPQLLSFERPLFLFKQIVKTKKTTWHVMTRVAQQSRAQVVGGAHFSRPRQWWCTAHSQDLSRMYFLNQELACQKKSKLDIFTYEHLWWLTLMTSQEHLQICFNPHEYENKNKTIKATQDWSSSFWNMFNQNQTKRSLPKSDLIPKIYSIVYS